MNRAQTYQRAQAEQAALDHLKRTVVRAPPVGAYAGLRTEVILLTPELAKQFIANQRPNRRPRESVVARYARIMKAGEWGLTGQGLIFNQAGKLMDGQHRCLAVIESGVSVRILATYGIEDSLWSRLDEVTNRNPSDGLSACGTANAAVIAAAAKLIFRETRGASLSNTSVSPTVEEVVEIATEAWPSINASASWVASSKLRRFLTTSIAAYAHLRCGLIDSGRRDWFFDRLDSGADLGKSSPVYILRERLMADRGAKARLRPADVLALLIKGWNAYVAGRTLRALRWRSDGDKPEAFPVWCDAAGAPHPMPNREPR